MSARQREGLEVCPDLRQEPCRGGTTVPRVPDVPGPGCVLKADLSPNFLPAPSVRGSVERRLDEKGGGGSRGWQGGAGAAVGHYNNHSRPPTSMKGSRAGVPLSLSLEEAICTRPLERTRATKETRFCLPAFKVLGQPSLCFGLDIRD